MSIVAFPTAQLDHSIILLAMRRDAPLVMALASSVRDLDPTRHGHAPPRPTHPRVTRSTSPRADPHTLQLSAATAAATAIAALFPHPSPPAIPLLRRASCRRRVPGLPALE